MVRTRVLALAAFAVCSTIWGSTWLAIKVGYEGAGPLTAASLRFFLASFVLVAVGVVLGVRWPRGRELALATFVGLVLFAADYGLIYWGEQFLETGLTAVLFATMPLFTAVFAHLHVPGERLGVRKLAGIALGVGGVALLFAGRLDLAGAPVVPMAAILGAAVCAGASSVATKRHGRDLHPVALTATATFVGASALAAAALALGEDFRIPDGREALASILYLALAGSVVTFLLYFWLLKHWSATSASFISVFTPVVAVFLGAAVLREALTWNLALGAAAILAGVVLNATRPRV